MSAVEKTIGRYRILERIGRGGMGVLYKGVDPMLDREVAIKVMSADFDSEENAADARERFFREARAAARLQHRNIVTIFEFGEDAGVPYQVMEFLRGRSLSARLSSDPPLTLAEKLDIVSELCTGLQFAHDNGVVHRDVKPGNVWLLEDGSVKLVDFGIAKLLSSTLTRHGDVLGSAYYMAPEQVFGTAVDCRADIFSTAVVLYELLAGRRPFEGESPTSTLLKIVQEEPHPLESIAPNLPQEVIAAVDRGLQKNPDDRYRSAAEFAADLQLARLSLATSETSVLSGTIDGEKELSRESAEEPVLDPILRFPGTLEAPADITSRARSRRVYLPVGLAVIAVLVLFVWWAARRPVSSDSAARRTTPVVVPTSSPPSNPGPPSTPATPRVIQVTSEPDGAAIEVDGQQTGLTTPAELPIGAQPPRRIRLTKQGFQPREAEVSAEEIANGSTTYSLAPEAPSVRLTATGGYSFSVFDGKRQISPPATSHQLTVRGGQSLRLVAYDYFLDYPFKVGGKGQSTSVSVPELGKLAVRTVKETCRALVNNRDLGNPPIPPFAVAPGAYRVQLKCPDESKMPTEVATVVSGQTTTMIMKVP